jgi:hypothetical protein
MAVQKYGSRIACDGSVEWKRMVTKVPEGGYHSNPSAGGKTGQCFLNAPLVGCELMPAKIALPETRDLPLSH